MFAPLLNIKTIQTGKFVHDIRFWILLFFLIRLYGIWFPPLDVSHNWRQTTVTMVARNFVETGPDLLHPRLDIPGDKTGITGMEFPLLNFLCYLVSVPFGYQHWYGRLIVLLVSSLGLWFFYLLSKRITDDKTAFCATWVLLFSIWFTYSRKIMPDTFSMSLILAGMYYSLKFLEKRRFTHLLLYTMLCSAGMLSKLPSAYLLILLVFPFIQSVPSAKLAFAAASLIPTGLSGWWYFIHVPELTLTYGFEHFFMGKSMAEGSREIVEHLPEALAKFYDVAIKYIGFAFFITGMVFIIKKKERNLLILFCVALLAFLPIVLKGGFTFYHHSYYIIPFVPVMALISGRGLASVPKAQLRWIFLAAVGIEGLLNHMDDFRIKEAFRPVEKLEFVLDSLGCGQGKVAVNSGAFTTPVYFTNRRGWVVFNGQLADKQFTDSLRRDGLEYIIILKRVFGENLELPFHSLLNNPDMTIYKLNIPADSAVLQKQQSQSDVFK